MASDNRDLSSDSDSELESHAASGSSLPLVNRGRSHSATLSNSSYMNYSFKANKSCLHQRSFDQDDWSYNSEGVTGVVGAGFNGILKTSRRRLDEKRISHSRSPPISFLTSVLPGEQPEISLLHVNPADLLSGASDINVTIPDEYQAPALSENVLEIQLDESETNTMLQQTVEATERPKDDEDETEKNTIQINTSSFEDNATQLETHPAIINQSALLANTVLNARLNPNGHDMRRASTTSIGNQSSAFRPAGKSNKAPRYVVSLLNERYSTNGVRLLVDGVRFIVDPAMLRAHPNTMLGRMFSSPHNVNRTADGDIMIGEGISASLFGILLDYYRGKPMRCPTAIAVQDLKDACDYFLIPFTHETVRCSNLRSFLHEISNDGAYELFEHFLEEEVLPQMVKCAQVGERECHIVVLTDDDIIDWDDNYPPQMPENELRSHIVHSTQMFRFLKYIENREVAKHVLTERGLKKIRIGIEGYPMYKEKIKRRPGYRPEVIYNYAQRPFLRMSWEEEENKSRHVDFQCVKSKSVTDLTSLEQDAVDRAVDLPASLTPATQVDIDQLIPYQIETSNTTSSQHLLTTNNISSTSVGAPLNDF